MQAWGRSHEGFGLRGFGLRGLAVALALAAPAWAQVRIVQTNSGNTNNIHLIDPATQRIVGEITNVPINHGAAASPDGRWLYFSSEAEQTLHVVDAKTLQTTKKIPLSGRPNNISIGRDGRRVYVGIVSAPGAVDVIDTTTLEKVKSIPTKGGIHNVYVTPDGKHVVAGSIAGRVMTVIDAKTDEPLWTLFDEGVRPMAFETNPDGSTKRIFVQLSELHGFAVVDFAQRKEVARRDAAQRHSGGEGGQGPVQRLAVARPGRRARREDAVGDQPSERARLRLLAAGPEAARRVDLGGRPDWVTFTPDSKPVYISTENTDSTIAIDVAIAQGSGDDHRRRRAEAEYHGGDAVGGSRLRASGFRLQACAGLASARDHRSQAPTRVLE